MIEVTRKYPAPAASPATRLSPAVYSPLVVMSTKPSAAVLTAISRTETPVACRRAGRKRGAERAQREGEARDEKNERRRSQERIPQRYQHLRVDCPPAHGRAGHEHGHEAADAGRRPRASGRTHRRGHAKQPREDHVVDESECYDDGHPAHVAASPRAAFEAARRAIARAAAAK